MQWSICQNLVVFSQSMNCISFKDYLEGRKWKQMEHSYCNATKCALLALSTYVLYSFHDKSTKIFVMAVKEDHGFTHST